jgi:hypothetical protein
MVFLRFFANFIQDKASYCYLFCGEGNSTQLEIESK